MSAIVNNAEKFIWNNFKMYLMQCPTCFLDNILKIKDDTATLPIDRYEDFIDQLDKHIQLGSYVVNQAEQFSDLPFVTMNIAAIPLTSCNTRVVIGFDIAFTTDSPRPDKTQSIQYVGNSSEAVASFRANIANGLDKIFHGALDDIATDPVDAAFFDRLRGQTIPNPVDPTDTREWKYNMTGAVDDECTISEVTQLKREDRSSAIAVFHIVYKMDLNRLYGDGVDCGC